MLMAQIIKQFADGSLLEFDAGSFDEWCIYLARPGQPRHAPRDVVYFAALQRLAAVHGARQLYGDFVKVYKPTGKAIDPAVLAVIESLAARYGPDAQEVEILLTLLHAAMVAEMNKRFSPLGKRIKRLGVRQVLLEGLTPEAAANYSKDKPWRQLAGECQKRGF